MTRALLLALLVLLTACRTANLAREDAAPDGGPAADGRADDGMRDKTTSDQAAVSPANFCYPRASCWEAPLPQGNRLYSVWGRGEDDVYAVGAQSTVLHFDGQTWTPVAVPTIAMATLKGIWGSGDELWIVSSSQVLLHYDGSRWDLQIREEFGQLSMNAIWGSGPADIFVVGSDSTVMHFDGTGWTATKVAQGASDGDELVAVWGSSSTDVWAASYRAIYRYDGATWAQVDTSPYSPEGLHGIWGSSAGEVFFNGLKLWRYDGFAWSEIDITGDFSSGRSIWGKSPEELYAVRSVGLAEQLWHFDGTIWSALPDPPLSEVPPTSVRFLGLWGTASGEVHVVGDGGTLLSYTRAGGWTSHVKLQGGEVTCLWGSDAEVVFAGRLGGEVLRRDPTGWTSTGFPSSEDVEGLWGSGPRSVYASSGGVIWHFDGDVWSKMPGPWEEYAASNGLWGRSESEIYVGAEPSDQPYGGVILRYDGAQWTTFKDLESCRVNALWGSFGGSDLFGAATCGIVRYDGETWYILNHVVVPATGFATSVWGDSPTNVYVAGSIEQGQQGMVWHFDETGWWSAMTMPAVGHLQAIWGQSATEIYATGWGGGGDVGAILRYDGTKWIKLKVTVGPEISALWGDGDAHVYAGGMYGTILHRGL